MANVMQQGIFTQSVKVRPDEIEAAKNGTALSIRPISMTTGRRASPITRAG